MKHAPAEKYYWMRYANARATNVTTPTGRVRIENGMLFGVRELRGKNADFDEVVVAATGEVFRLEITKSEKLMDRAKEFKGRTPVIAQPSKAKTTTPKVQDRAKVVKDRRVVIAPTVQKSADSEMKALLKKHGLTLQTITKASVTKALRKIAAAADDATALRLKKWLLTRVKPQLATFLETFDVVEHRPVKIQPTQPRPKAQQQQPTHHPKVKLSEVEMPEVDDFIDDELPSEFRRFMNSENAAKGK